MDLNQKEIIHHTKPEGEGVAGGKLCTMEYLSGICCIGLAEYDTVCGFHYKGETSRVVKCTSFAKGTGEKCKKSSEKKKYSEQDELTYLCYLHNTNVFQRGHHFRSGLPTFILDKVVVSPSSSLEKNLCAVISGKKLVIVSAPKFNGR